jgi:hypothetical protein
VKKGTLKKSAGGPPKCRLCGHEHWSNEPHRIGGSVANCVSGTQMSVANAGSKERSRRWRERNRALYNERQAKLMRARRQKVASA